MPSLTSAAVVAVVALLAPLAQRPGQLVAAGLLQATSLGIPLVAGAVGVNLGVIQPDNYVALIAACLLSVVLFPPLALPRLAGPRSPPPAPARGG